MSTPPGLAGKWKNLVKEEYPYIFDSDVKPAGKKGQPCRILATETGDHIPKGQGLVMIQFKNDDRRFCVLKKKLKKVPYQSA